MGNIAVSPIFDKYLLISRYHNKPNTQIYEKKTRKFSFWKNL